MESLRVCLVLLLFKKIKSLTKGNCFLPAALTKAIFYSTIPKAPKEVFCWLLWNRPFGISSKFSDFLNSKFSDFLNWKSEIWENQNLEFLILKFENKKNLEKIR
jgi:hypothetical protein